MKSKTLLQFGKLGLCAFAVACDGGSNDTKTGSVATVTGRLESDAGADSASRVSLLSIDDDGKVTAVATGAVSVDGHFEVAAPPSEGPFILRAEAASGIGVAASILPIDLGGGELRTVPPLSSETSLEAKAYLAALAGSATRADIDPIALMIWIDARTAAASQDGDAPPLGAAFLAAQEAWLRSASLSIGSEVTASVVSDAEQQAWIQFGTAMNAATTAEARAAAEATLTARIGEALETELGSRGLDASARADAATSAAVMWSSSLEGSARLAAPAQRQAALISTRANHRAELAVVAATGAEAAVSARLDAAYEAWVTRIEAASDEEAMADAWTELAGRITGNGSVTADSALGTLVASEHGEAQIGLAVAAMAATTTDASGFSAAIDLALSGASSGRAEAVAQAIADYRAALDARLASHTELSAAVRAFIAESSAQVGASGGVLFDLDIRGLLGGLVGRSLTGRVEGGLGFQSGADIAFGDASFEALATAASATLVELGSDGGARVLADGTLTATGFAFASAPESSGFTFVALRDAAGALVGAVEVQASERPEQAPVLTQETTVEALVVLDMVARGEDPEAIDRGQIALLIDGAVAATAWSSTDRDEAVSSLAVALQAAMTARAESLDSDSGTLGEAGMAALVHLEGQLSARGEAADQAYADFRAELALAVQAATGASVEDYEQAQAEAAATFEIVLEHLSEGSSLAAAGEARARIEGALALQAMSAGVGEATFAGRDGEVRAAVSAFLAATQEAGDEASLDAAAEVFVSAMTGFSTTGESGGFLANIAADLQLGLATSILETAITGSFTAADAWSSAIEGAAVLAIDANGTFDSAAFAASEGQASTTFEAAITSTFSGLVSGWSTERSDAMSSLVAMLALSFHDQAE